MRTLNNTVGEKVATHAILIDSYFTGAPSWRSDRSFPARCVHSNSVARPSSLTCHAAENTSTLQAPPYREGYGV